jgi:hypothetical protein
MLATCAQVSRYLSFSSASHLALLALRSPGGVFCRTPYSGGQAVDAGTAAGVVCSLGMSRLLASQLFGVQATDVMTFTLVTVVLVVTMLLACYIPARRAAKIDPMVALRDE